MPPWNYGCLHQRTRRWLRRKTRTISAPLAAPCDPRTTGRPRRPWPVWGFRRARLWVRRQVPPPARQRGRPPVPQRRYHRPRWARTADQRHCRPTDSCHRGSGSAGAGPTGGLRRCRVPSGQGRCHTSPTRVCSLRHRETGRHRRGRGPAPMSGSVAPRSATTSVPEPAPQGSSTKPHTVRKGQQKLSSFPKPLGVACCRAQAPFSALARQYQSKRRMHSPFSGVFR